MYSNVLTYKYLSDYYYTASKLYLFKIANDVYVYHIINNNIAESR
jgi:hypothetical protein